jgi:glycosyltransferase involved in cell wall biosynthesis
MAFISVVIPTRNRPELVCRAVRSVIQQTYSDLEVLVVIDGPDRETAAALGEMNDPRLQLIALGESVGGAEARNVGIREAVGTWIALLDDDDEWFPTKLAEQIEVASRLGSNCLIATRYFDRRTDSEMIQPTAAPRRGQHISEYLFSETSILGFRTGFLQTSTWLASRQAFLAVPFTKDLARNQDTDWLLRATPVLNLELHVVWKPLAVFHNETRPGRINTKWDWRYSLNWAIDRREDFTRRSFPFFVATVCTYPARVQGESTQAFLDQLDAAFKYGRPNFKCLWLFFANWYIFPLGRSLPGAAKHIKAVYRFVQS